MNNELQARYRARQPSEARRQANTESQRIRSQQETAEQSETRRQRDAASHRLLRECQCQVNIFLLSRQVLKVPTSF